MDRDFFCALFFLNHTYGLNLMDCALAVKDAVFYEDLKHSRYPIQSLDQQC